MISKKIEPSSKLLRQFFFIAGIIATIAYRIIPFLNPAVAAITWYVGTIGFVIYFGHRTQIETKRANLVKEYDLMNEIGKSSIATEKKEALSYLIGTSLTSKARFNSLFIFIASLVFLFLNLALDCYRFFAR